MEQNNLLSHGLLSEDFKQNIIKFVHEHPLDIQTKTIILDSVLMSAHIAANKQTQVELEEYRKIKENQENTLKKEVSN